MWLSDPNRAISFDRLHAYHGGLFGDHLWPEVKAHIEALGRPAISLVDKL